MDTKIKMGLVDKLDISRFIDNSNSNKKIATLATKSELNSEQDKITKPQAFDSSYSCGKSQKDDETQNTLIFFISDQFTSSYPSDGKWLKNFQGSTLFH